MASALILRARLLALLARQYVTPIDALNHAGCLSLSQRVGEMIREGVLIHKKWVALPGGKKCMSYKLVK